MQFRVTAVWANDEGDFDAAYEFGSCVGGSDNPEATATGGALEIGLEVTRYLESLDPYAVAEMAGYGPGLRLILKVEPLLPGAPRRRSD